MVLNPLGVPSRMNVGQILETHLGWASYMLGRRIRDLVESIVDPLTGVNRIDTTTESKSSVTKKIRDILLTAYKGSAHTELIEGLSDTDLLDLARREMSGIRVATPVFDAARESDIQELLRFSGVPEDGKVQLYDGRTGEAFAERGTVGVMYILKLDHLVDDKIHARSIGPYSLVTQQPLGGKAQFGGQRLGEMEVWALEAYGAAYTLQEFLTVKSDDVAGRTRMYESIVKGEHVLEPGLPESFNVMMKELQALCLDVELVEEQPAVEEEVAPQAIALNGSISAVV